jgi:hypothetical protein
VDDDLLLTRLRAVLDAADAPPPDVVDLAKGLFTLRALDAELADLTADSDADSGAVAVRDAGTDVRLLTFEAGELTIEAEVSGVGPVRRVVGQVLPAGAGTVEARQPSRPGPRTVEVDERGRFALDDVRPGPLSLTCRRPGARPVTTSWLDIG